MIFDFKGDKKRFLIVLYSLFLLIWLVGCKPYNPNQDHITDMKMQLSAINQKLGVAPLSKMDVFSKPCCSYVSLRYKPENIKLFTKMFYVAAEEQGFISHDRYDLLQGEEGQILICNVKVRPRYIAAYLFENFVTIEIMANNNPPLFGKAPCY